MRGIFLWCVAVAGCADRPLPLPLPRKDASVTTDQAVADLAAPPDLAVVGDPDLGRGADLARADLSAADLSPSPCPGVAWTRVFGSGYNEVVGATAAGEVILAGGFNTRIAFGGTVLTTYGGDDYLVALDGDGQARWGRANAFASAISPTGVMAGWTDVAPDADGGVPDGGAYHDWLSSWSADGGVRWQAGVRDATLLAYGPDGDLWTAALTPDLTLMRLDGHGAARWSETLPTADGTPGVFYHQFPMHGGAVDGYGHFLLAASLVAPGGLGDGDPIADNTHQLLAYDGTGALAYKRVSTSEIYTHAAAGPTGATAIAGVESSSSIVIEQIDGNGATLWKRSFHSSGGVTTTGLAVTPTGGVVWAGSAADVDFGSGTLAGSGLMVVSLDASGQHRWSRKLGLVATCNVATFSERMLAVDGAGNVYVAGCSWGSSFDFCGTSYPTETGNIVLTKLLP
jgi:hypothetical protein